MRGGARGPSRDNADSPLARSVRGAHVTPMRWSFLALALIMGAVVPLVGADVLLPMSPVGQVWTKTVPSFQGAWIETEEDPFKLLDQMDLKLKRFVARNGLNQVKPLM